MPVAPPEGAGGDPALGYISAVTPQGLAPIGDKPDSLTDIVFQAIREAIVTKAIPPGGAVSEAKLAAQLNVSKTPVREALLRLRHVGLVERDGRGLRVARLSPDAIRNAYELRSSLEQASARFATLRATKAQRSTILELAQASLSAADQGDGHGFRTRDDEFHRAVAMACGNALLRESVEDALMLTAALRARDVPPSGDSIECAWEHVRIAEALRDGDAALAGQGMGEHVEHVLQIVLRQLSSASSTAEQMTPQPS